MNSQTIRNKFLDFFVSKNHQIHSSAPIVSKNDPSLMFVNSGMAPFKEFFLGESNPKSKRIANSQKCLRVSGKHNDLEEVGIDTYHHTFFEMLGNWSFGDYFKKEAIEWSWELLTKVYKINPDNLYVTIFCGSNKDNVPLDTEAYDIWKKIIPEERILNFEKKDNFWEMGDQGPCGPCSEIHIDLRDEKEKNNISGRDLVNKDHPKVVELWNLVFIQYNRKANGKLEDLPKKHIDTGMGFERLCMVLQGVKSSYDTDVFSPLIKELEIITDFKYGSNEKIDIAIRVIVDHLRAVTFSIADGQLPSNTGAGYVIRRILRRGVRYGYTFLNQKKPFIYKLVKILSAQFSTAFPEIKGQIEIIENVIEAEESSFLRTLEKGILKLNEIILTSSNKIVSGSDAFELYDTFGFPIDLTALILRENEMNFDLVEFDSLMKIQKNRSRFSLNTSNEEWIKLLDSDQTKFVGYDELSSVARLVRYRKSISKKGHSVFQLVFDKTPFYAQGGGQVGDIGILESFEKEKISISNTIKENDTVIHIVDILPQNLNSSFNLMVDNKSRLSSSSNHTATHLLHEALRFVLGTHVQQKGSMVSDKYLRFDFSHFSKLSEQEIDQIQVFVNQKIIDQLPIEENRSAIYKDCIDQGVIALFGEKYGETVRLVKFGNSHELCGGTHVSNTSQIRAFIITSESAISTGIRRIEAISGSEAISFLINQSKTLKKVNSLLSNDKDPLEAINKIKNQSIAVHKKLEKTNNELSSFYIKELKLKAELVEGVNFCKYELSCEPSLLKNLAFNTGKEIDDLFLVLTTKFDGKAYVVCYISKNLVESKQLNANLIVKKLGKHIEGSGGGQPFFASASGNNINGISKILKEASSFLKT